MGVSWIFKVDFEQGSEVWIVRECLICPLDMNTAASAG